MKFLRALIVLFMLLALGVVIVLVLGSRLPHQHTASVSITIPAPRDRVWHLIEDVGSQPAWRPGLKAVEPLPDENGHPCWTEVQSGMRMPLCEDTALAPATRIVRIADPKLAFGGTWTYQLTALDANTTVVTITENGTTGPAVWRFLGHYVFHEDTQIKQYEAALKKKAEQS